MVISLTDTHSEDEQVIARVTLSFGNKYLKMHLYKYVSSRDSWKYRYIQIQIDDRYKHMDLTVDIKSPMDRTQREKPTFGT